MKTTDKKINGMKIGFDFGMTNSTLCFFNPESKTLDSFRFSASTNDYIPTIVSYDTQNSDISIGAEAKGNITQEVFEVHQNFKLHLGRNYNKKLGNNTKTSIQATKDYIKYLLKTFEEEKDNLDFIVMTVPEIWVREASNSIARENIADILDEFGYEFKLVPEPEAAAVYFCWAYENDTFKKYNGHIVVVDYGGGTLDVTLCRSDNGNITGLEGCGFGESNETNGRAGAAFDEAVVERLLKSKKISLEKNSIDFIELRNNFENLKITQAKKITEHLKIYFTLKEQVKDKVLFNLRYNGANIPVYCEDLVECFEEINTPELIKSLDEISQHFNKYNINSSELSQDSFRVLLVGGFSNFYPVEVKIREFFKSKPRQSDDRFNSPKAFNNLNRALAIAKGAAIIAQSAERHISTCSETIGFVGSYISSDKSTEPIYIPVIEKGAKLSELKNPIFSKYWLESRIKHKGSIKIFIDNGKPNDEGRAILTMDEAISKLIPPQTREQFQIGFSVDRNGIPTIYIRDKNNVVVKEQSLRKLIEENLTLIIREKV